MPSLDTKQLASHYLTLNSAWEAYSRQWLFQPIAQIFLANETELYLRPNGIWTLEYRTIKNGEWKDVTQQKTINHTLDEYISNPEDMFYINRAIFRLLDKLITFDLQGEQIEYAMYK